MVETDAPAAFATSRIVMWLPRPCRFGFKLPTLSPAHQRGCKRILGVPESNTTGRFSTRDCLRVEFVPTDINETEGLHHLLVSVQACSHDIALRGSWPNLTHADQPDADG